MNTGLNAELAAKCLHEGQNTMKTSVCRISDFIRDPELKTLMPMANDAENLYEVVKAVSDLAVHSRSCARLMTAQKIHPKLLATHLQRDLVENPYPKTNHPNNN